MVPHGGLHLHKRGKNTSSGNYTGKLYKDLPFYLHLFKRQSDGLKQK